MCLRLWDNQMSSKEKPPKNLKDRLAAVQGEAELTDVTRDKNMPPGWEPGVVWEGTEGTITADPIDSDVPNWDKMLLARGLNPEVYEVAEDVVRFSSWDGANGERKFSFKAAIRIKRPASYVLQEDVYQGIRKAKKVKHKPPSGDCHFVVALRRLAGWQQRRRRNGGTSPENSQFSGLDPSTYF